MGCYDTTKQWLRQAGWSDGIGLVFVASTLTGLATTITTSPVAAATGTGSTATIPDTAISTTINTSVAASTSSAIIVHGQLCSCCECTGISLAEL